ncbi:MAG: holdfast anchoring protein HfaA [bacterium]
MRQNTNALRTLAALIGAAATLYAGNAAASGDYDQSSSYSVGYGMQPGEENAPISGSTRDENGNKVFVNGVATGSAYAVTDHIRTSGVGGAGTGAGSATATAIGNALNVTVTGSWNTVIVNSKQVNNGDQNASLNGDIHF